MVIPSFLLAKLYVKGSLRNVPEGLEFYLKNVIDSTSLVGLGPVAAGGTSYEAASLVLTVKERSWAGAELSGADAAPVPVGTPMRILVKGASLPPGKASLKVAAVSSDIGAFAFEISDVVA